MAVELKSIYLDITFDILLCLLIVINMNILFFILSSFKPYLVDLYLLLHI